jgi:hypothetical protein
MSLVKSLRIDQAESIQGSQYPASQGIHSTTARVSGSVEGCEVDSL